jgi:aspartyl-tRNA(Asn)/glutamyl-tRNA(Gln) amidotransferase subunit B
MNWIQTTSHYKSVVNWILGPIREYLNETGLTYTQLNTSFIQLNEILNLVESNQLSFANATGKVFKGIVGTNMSALQFAQEQQLIQNNSTDAINQWVEQVLNAHPEKVAAYKNGKKGLMGVFIGEVKKISKGQADPKKTTQILEKKLV